MTKNFRQTGRQKKEANSMYEFVHTKLGFCFWDIPALIVLIAIIAIFVVHVIRQKRRENEFEDELSDKMAQKAAAENAEKRTTL